MRCHPSGSLIGQLGGASRTHSPIVSSPHVFPSARFGTTLPFASPHQTNKALLSCHRGPLRRYATPTAPQTELYHTAELHNCHLITLLNGAPPARKHQSAAYGRQCSVFGQELFDGKPKVHYKTANGTSTKLTFDTSHHVSFTFSVALEFFCGRNDFYSCSPTVTTAVAATETRTTARTPFGVNAHPRHKTSKFKPICKPQSCA